MSSRRCRLTQSSSQGETGLCTQIQPLCEQKPKNSKKEQQKQPGRSIFRVSSPPRETSDVAYQDKQPAEGFMVFLQCCSLCKKQLKKDKNVYMYGYLTAFCSPECRDDQMALDGFDQKIAADRQAKMMEYFGKSMTPKQKWVCTAAKF